MDNLWNGFRCEEFTFEERKAIVVFPHDKTSNGKLALKTEYWNAFPDVEIRLLEQGFHLAYIKNKNRFATQEDCDIKARFVRHLAQTYALDERCVPVGMSLGGAHAVRFAGFYPELVSCLFLDAPVLSFSSYPGKFGSAECEPIWQYEFAKAYPGVKRYQLLNFDAHPVNMADTLIANRIPILMVYGTADESVIYEENGRLFEDAFEGTDLLTIIPAPGRAHHPHGLGEDNGKIVQFILDHCH